VLDVNDSDPEYKNPDFSNSTLENEAEPGKLLGSVEVTGKR
jgi:hypothetical protein